MITKDLLTKMSNIAHKHNINMRFYHNRPMSNDTLNDNSIIKKVTLHIIDKCNLNCAYCDTFSPLIANDWREDIHSFYNTIKQFRLLFEDVLYFNISGGEPLLHPHVLDFCSILRFFYPHSHIIIITNGILLEHLNRIFVEKLTQLNVHLVITKYPIPIKYDNIIYNYNRHRQICTISPRDNMLNIKLHKLKSDNENYYNCLYAGLENGKRIRPRCIQLNSNGNLYFCSLLGNLHLLSKYFNINFELIEGIHGDYINIFDNINKNDIVKQLNEKIPFCAYCSSHTHNDMVDWKPSNKDIHEWIVDTHTDMKVELSI